MSEKLLAFSWIGGKFMQLGFILPHLSTSHTTYVESFGGSAAVLLNKQQSPVEIYNDLYEDVVTFFKVLRDQDLRENLINLLNLTPYSRKEFVEALKKNDKDSMIEKARKFFITAKQVTGGLATSATSGRWGYAIKDSRRGMALPVSRWLSAIPRLEEVGTRLQEVQFENLNALDVIQRYDTANTLHYIDPPYLMETRSGGKAYKHEMSVEQHGQLLDLLIQCKGKVVLSGYDNKLYNSRLASWSKFEDKPKNVSSLRRHQSTSTRTDCLWRNF